MNNTQYYKKLEKEVEEIYKINNITNILYCDLSTCAPINSRENRKKEIEYLQQLSNQKLTSNKIAKLIAQSKKEADSFDKWQRVNLQEIIKKHKLAISTNKAIKTIHIKNTIECESIWHSIKIKKLHQIKPSLQKVISSVQVIAKERKSYLNTESSYEALVDQYSPNLKTSLLKKTFKDLKSNLPPIIKEIQEKQKLEDVHQIPDALSRSEQLQLNTTIAQLLGFDFKRGRVDQSSHYFCGGSPYDVRLLLKSSNNFLENIMKLVHEVGHGLYEQNLPNNYKNQPVGKSAGMVAHESQSLIMEMHVARSMEFMALISKILRDQYNLKGNIYSPENLYKNVTRVRPNNIRLESDELTYLLHIILRCEIEEDIVEGNLGLDELPAIWNKKMQLYLGITPNSDREGCLQDIHWFKGYFGYFPAYCVGSILASMMVSRIQNLDTLFFSRIEKGDFSEINNWLNSNIRKYGALENIQQLVEKQTDQLLSVNVYLDNIKKKYLRN